MHPFRSRALRFTSRGLRRRLDHHAELNCCASQPSIFTGPSNEALISVPPRPRLFLLLIQGRAVTPSMFFKMASPNGKPAPMSEDYARLFRLDWDALVTGHGGAITAGAKAIAAASHAHQFSNLMPTK